MSSAVGGFAFGRLLPALFASAFMALGIAWSFASPPGSTNDADYHYASIWCAWGEWEGCQFTSPVNAYSSDKSDTSDNFWIPEYVRSVNCFQFASQSTACLKDKTAVLVDSNRRNSDYYPSIYYSAMRTVVLGNDPVYMQVVRIVNVTLAALLIGLSVFVAGPALRRAAILAWGLAAIPWVVMFSASVHPSSWMVTGAGTFWVFLLASLSKESSTKLRLLSVMGLVLSTFIALASRFDGAAWLLLGVTLAAVFSVHRQSLKSGARPFLISAIGVATLATFVVALNWRRLGLGSFGIPEWNRATDQPLPILKVLLEFPWWVASFWGAQQPLWIPSDTDVQRTQAGYVPVGLSVNLGDFYFPSAVGYLIAGAAMGLIVITIHFFSRRNWVALAILTFAIIIGVLGMRATVFFGPQNLLSRYYFPWLILMLGAIFLLPSRRKALVTNGQAIVLGAMLITGGGLAWLAVAGRYALNLSGTFTNFGQNPVWWWELGPSRLIWFMIAFCATAFWVAMTLLAARSPLPPRVKSGRHP